MLDEPVGSLPLHLERPLPQPIARHLQERQKEREALIFCSLLTGVLHRFVQKSIITCECSKIWLVKTCKSVIKAVLPYLSCISQAAFSFCCHSLSWPVKGLYKLVIDFLHESWPYLLYRCVMTISRQACIIFS